MRAIYKVIKKAIYNPERPKTVFFFMDALSMSSLMWCPGRGA